MTAFWVEVQVSGKAYTYRLLVIAGRVAVCTYTADQYDLPWKIIGESWTDIARQALERGHVWKILE